MKKGKIYKMKNCDHGGRIDWGGNIEDIKILGFVICYDCPLCGAPVLCNSCSGFFWEKKTVKRETKITLTP